MEAEPNGPRIAQQMVQYSRARDVMFKATDTDFAPWIIVPSDDKKRARLNCIRHLLKVIPHKDAPRIKIKLPKRSTKGGYDDVASLKGLRFVEETALRSAARCRRVATAPAAISDRGYKAASTHTQSPEAPGCPFSLAATKTARLPRSKTALRPHRRIRATEARAEGPRPEGREARSPERRASTPGSRKQGLPSSRRPTGAAPGADKVRQASKSSARLDRPRAASSAPRCRGDSRRG